jgi:uncharacterized membrane protein
LSSPSRLGFDLPAPTLATRAFPAASVGLATAVALALRIFLLGHQSLWVDEYLTWHTAYVGTALPFADILRNDHGPLLQMILHLWTGLVGDSGFSLRLPSALATTALVPVLAALAARVLGVGMARPAAWLAALSPFLVWYGQEARNYALAMLFATLAALAAWDWQERGDSRQGVWLVLWAWLGLLSNLNVALVLPFLLAWVALPHQGRRGNAKGALLALLAIALLEAPWAVAYAKFTLYSRLSPISPVQPANTTIREGTVFSWGAFPFTFSAFSVGYSFGPSLLELHDGSPLAVALRHWLELLLAAVVFGALAVSGLVALWRERERLVFCAGLLLLPLLCVTYFSLRNFKVFNPRYVSSGLAGYYLILLAGWAAFPQAARRVAAVSVLALWGWSLGHYYFDPNHAKEDYRAATAWLGPRVQAHDQLIGAGSPAMLEYYWRRKPVHDSFWLGLAADSTNMVAQFDSLRDSTRTAYVVVSRPYAFDPHGRFESFLSKTRGVEKTGFHGVTVYRLPAVGLAR